MLKRQRKQNKVKRKNAARDEIELQEQCNCFTEKKRLQKWKNNTF